MESDRHGIQRVIGDFKASEGEQGASTNQMVALVAIASFALAQILWGVAIASIGLASTSPVALLIPIFGVGLAALLLGEHLNAQVLLSAAVVLAGVGVHVVPMALNKPPVPQGKLS